MRNSCVVRTACLVHFENAAFPCPFIVDDFSDPAVRFSYLFSFFFLSSDAALDKLSCMFSLHQYHPVRITAPSGGLLTSLTDI